MHTSCLQLNLGLSALAALVLGPLTRADTDECASLEYGGTVTIGAGSSDYVNHLAVAQDGAVIIGGSFGGTVDFDPSETIDEHTDQGQGDAFATSFLADLSYSWTYTAGGALPDAVWAVGVAPDGSIHAGGLFYDTVDFDPGDEEDLHTSNGSVDVFLTRLFDDGLYSWTLTYGGAGPEGGERFAFEQDGTILVLGRFSDLVDFDPSQVGEAWYIPAGFDDTYLTYFDPDGDYLDTLTIGGSGATALPRQPAVLSDDSLILSGYFAGTVDFDPSIEGVEERTSNAGSLDIYVVKLHKDGGLDWVHTFGTPGVDGVGGVAVNGDDQLFLTGDFSDAAPMDFDPTDGVDERMSNGSNDIFVVKLGPDGSYHWTWTAGSSYYEYGAAIAVDAGGGPYATGRFGDDFSPGGYVVDFDQAGSGDFHTTVGRNDAWVTHLLFDGSYAWTYTFGGDSNDCGRAIGVGAVGEVFVAGSFQKTVDFDPSESVDVRTSVGRDDAFLTLLRCSGNLPCEGDANGDRAVDPLDVGFVLARFGCGVNEGDALCDAADVNGDETVDPLDVGFVQSRLGECS